MHLSHPRGFHDPKLLADRRALIEVEPRVQALREWSDALARKKGVVPHFDPAEAGTGASVLLLLEAPGPMTNADGKRPGSGFVSVDNDDATAEQMWRTRDEVGLHDGVLCWNIVPWYLGAASRKPTARELREGGAALLGVLDLLPELHTVVASGRYAQRGWRDFARTESSLGLRTIETWHPSPLSMAQKGHRAEFTAALSRAARDWRTDELSEQELRFERDATGASVAAWYLNDEGDRIDVHPRWWNSSFD